MSDQEYDSSNVGDTGVSQLYDRSMEEALIGAVLITPIVFLDVSTLLKAEDFYYRSNQWIWTAFQSLYSSDPNFDLLTVKQELEAQGHLEDVGGVEYLASLTNQVPSSLHAEAYARNINALATRRRLLASANEIAKLAHRKDINLETVVDQAEEAIFGVSQDREKHDLVPISSVARNYFERLSEMSEKAGEFSGLETGLKVYRQGPGRYAEVGFHSRGWASWSGKDRLSDWDCQTCRAAAQTKCGDILAGNVGGTASAALVGSGDGYRLPKTALRQAFG